MATLDTLLFVDSLPSADEALVGVREVAMCLGGKGVIPALTLRGLGADSGLLCLTSAAIDDSHLNHAIRRALGGEFLIPALDRANATWILIAEDGRTHTAVRVGSHPELDLLSLSQTLRRFMASFSALYIAAEVPALLTEVLTECRGREIDIVVNVSNAFMRSLKDDPDIFSGILRRARCLLMNEEEEADARTILKISEWSELDSPSLECLVVTAGRRGGRHSAPPFRAWHPFSAMPTSSLCPAGAGDVFAGAFLKYWLVETESTETACEKAALIASEKVRKRITGMLLHQQT